MMRWNDTKFIGAVLGIFLAAGGAMALAQLTPAPATQPTTSPFAKDLLTYYPLDGNANDASGGNHSGKAIDARPAPDRFGRPNHACAFDGAKSEIVIDPPPLLSAKGFTVSLWVKFDFPKDAPTWKDVTDGNTAFSDPIIGQDDGYSIRSWQLWTWEQKIVWHRQGEYSSAWTPQPVESAKWYHVAAVWDGKEHHLYLNGAKEHSAAGIFKPSRDEPLRIGAKGDTTTKRAFFAGAMDEVRIYGRALTAEEMRALAQQGL